ncbi:MAG: PadR family transcriptional regulator [Coprobacillus sp.]
MNPKYEGLLKKGVLEILVLQFLSKKEMYGYQLIMELKENSHEMFAMKEGTLYPILYRLEDDGMLISEWSQPSGKEVSKKYYKITEDGKRTLAELKKLWSSFSKEVELILGDDNYG